MPPGKQADRQMHFLIQLKNLNLNTMLVKVPALCD